MRLASEDDRNKFAFILFDGTQYRHFRYTSVIFGFVSSPFFLACVLKHHALQNPDPHIRDVLASNFYVDNFVYSCTSSNDLCETSLECTRHLKQGGFTLRAWASNCTALTKQLPKDKIIESDKDIKVLGYLINVEKDTMSSKTCTFNEKAETKRQILSSASNFFDPLGFFAPVTSYSKLILREISNLKLDWDDPIPSSLQNDWQTFAMQCNSHLNNIEFARHTFNNDSPLNLHVFSDASTKLLGVAIYVVQNDNSHLIYAKSKLAPLVGRTLPTLELMALNLACSVTSNVIDNYHFPRNKIESITFYSDSQVCLSWTVSGQGPKRNVFACNRIKDVNNYLKQFRENNIEAKLSYVPTAENPSDCLTRPVKPAKFHDDICSQFHRGPDWLITDEIPYSELKSVPVKFISPDKKLVCPVMNQSQPSVLDSTRFSSYNKMINTMAYVIKFTDIYLNRPVQDFVDYKARATVSILKIHQARYFGSELKYLTDPDEGAKVPSLVVSLNLFLDGETGLLRTRGRVVDAERFNFEVTNPVLVHGKSDLARLLILNAHRQSLHLGVDSTLNVLRNEGIWLTFARGSVKRNLSENCYICKRYNNHPFDKPNVPTALPSFRTKFTRAYEHCGVDYTGAFNCVGIDGKITKIYILLFSCMVTRAVHLEVVPNMTAEEFVQAFVRLSNRYGVPTVIYSDNAKQFQLGGSLLSKILLSDHVTEMCRTRNVTFRNIPVYSPTFGGTYERMVGIVKKCITKSFRQTAYTIFQFMTILTDVMNVVNNRPLTYVGTDRDSTVITPNLLSNPCHNYPRLALDRDNVHNVWNQTRDPKALVDVYTSMNERIEQSKDFAKTLHHAYLLSLREQHRKEFNPKNKSQPWLKEGSICFHDIKDDRAVAPLVKIVKLMPGKDGRVRVVRILKSDQKEVSTTVDNLVPLELCAVERSRSDPPSAPPAQDVSSTPRPMRLAAQGSQRNWRDLAFQGAI